VRDISVCKYDDILVENVKQFTYVILHGDGLFCALF